MLVLSRTLGEGIQVGDVLVKVLDVRGQRVKLGIEAPPERRIERVSAEETAEIIRRVAG